MNRSTTEIKLAIMRTESIIYESLLKTLKEEVKDEELREMLYEAINMVVESYRTALKEQLRI